MGVCSDILIDTNELLVALCEIKSRPFDGIERHFMGALRVVFDDVERLRKLKFTYNEIAQVFQSKGIETSSKRLRSYMSRIRRERLAESTASKIECATENAIKSQQITTIGSRSVSKSVSECLTKSQQSDTKSPRSVSLASLKDSIDANKLPIQGMHLQLLRSRG